MLNYFQFSCCVIISSEKLKIYIDQQ